MNEIRLGTIDFSNGELSKLIWRIFPGGTVDALITLQKDSMFTGKKYILILREENPS